MVGSPAMADAVDRARRLPSLKVGLHLVLVEGHPLLPASEIPDLVDDEGRFRNDLTRAGVEIFLRSSVQRQVAAEIEAQFEAFAATGLTLDHVDAHKHYHLHPVIARLLVTIGQRYGMASVRVPSEPAAQIRRMDPGTPASPMLWPYTTLLRRRLRRSGIAAPDRVYGYAWSGAMDVDRVETILRDLPPGRSEIYFHPATTDVFPGSCAGYGYRRELDALTSPRTIAAVRQALDRDGDRVVPVRSRGTVAS
jgi:hopanoid biosynthesis associated protein HpnK